MVGAPAQGSSAVNTTTGAITYTSTGTAGTDTFTYTVEDNDGILSRQATVTIDVNSCPTANDDAVSTDEETVGTGSVLSDNGNGADSDPENDTLTVSEVNGSGANVGVQIALASGALLTVNADGTYSYDPNGQFNDLGSAASDTDSFTYTIGDGNAGCSDTATVTMTINGVNDCPTAQDDDLGTDEDTMFGGDVKANNGNGADTDPDTGDTLSVVEVNGAAFTPGSPFALPSGALLAMQTNGSFIYNPDGQFESLAAAATASDGFTYGIQDAVGACLQTATVSITITGVNDNPSVTGESFDTVGNTQLEVAATQTISTGIFVDSDVSGTLLANDSDIDGPGPLTASLANANGAAVTVNSDGTFVYTPTAGASSPVTFTYTVSDSGGGSTNGTVNITLVGEVWYVQNNAAAGGTGRSIDPFDTLAEADSASGANDTVYIFRGDGTTTNQNAGISLGASQRVIGEGVALVATGTVNGVGTPTLRGAGSTPIIGNSGGHGVTLGTDAVLSGFDISNTSGAKISGTSFNNLTASTMTLSGSGQALALNTGTLNCTFASVTSSSSSTNSIDLDSVAGTLTINGGALSGATNAEFDVNGGNATISYPGTITNSSGRVVSVTNLTGGTVTFSGGISDTGGSGTGILCDNNDQGGTGTVNFTGGLNLSTGANAAFTATNGGIVNATQNNTSIVNTLTTSTGTALNVANTTIGGSGLTFRSISVNGATNGILLNTTGSSGGLTVTGSGGTDGSGGTIQNTSGRGASFVSASNISLSSMNFTSAGTSDLDADNSGLTTGDNLATNAAIHLQTITTCALDNLNITNGAEQGINGHNVNGFSLSNSVMASIGNGPDEDGLHFYNMVGTCSLTNNSISSSGDDNVNIQNNTTPIAPPVGTGSISISSGSYNTGVLGSGLLFGIRGTSNTTISVSGVTINDNFSGGVVADCFDTATMDVEVSTSTITNNNDAIAISCNNGTTTFDIHDMTNLSGQDFANISILKASLSTGGTLEGFIRNNGNIAVANGRPADAVIINQSGGGTLRASVTNNTIDYAGTQRGILLQSGSDGSGALEATVTGNTMDIELDGTGNAVNGILAQCGVADPQGAGASMCIDIGGAGGLANTFTHSLGGSIAGGDIRIRQRFNNALRVPGIADNTTDTSVVATHLNGRNNEVSASTASINLEIDGGAACLQP